MNQSVFAFTGLSFVRQKGDKAEGKAHRLRFSHPASESAAAIASLSGSADTGRPEDVFISISDLVPPRGQTLEGRSIPGSGGTEQPRVERTPKIIRSNLSALSLNWIS